MHGSLWELGKCIRSPGAGDSSSCELPSVGARNQTRILAARALNCRVISPTSRHWFKKKKYFVYHQHPCYQHPELPVSVQVQVPMQKEKKTNKYQGKKKKRNPNPWPPCSRAADLLACLEANLSVVTHAMVPWKTRGDKSPLQQSPRRRNKLIKLPAREGRVDLLLISLLLYYPFEKHPLTEITNWRLCGGKSHLSITVGTFPRLSF